MSYNGSGTFNINSAGQPVVSGTVISSTAFNALTSDLATGLTTALTKDGQTTPTANITLGGYKITNLAAGTAAADAVRFDQLTGAGVPLITVAGTANAITGTITPSLTVYTTGGVFSFVVGSTNTAAVTLNIDGVGVKSVTRTGSVALVAGDMVAGQVVLVEYDGTQFQLINGNNLRVAGTTSGIATIVTPAVAGTPTITLPIVTGTLATLAGTETLTNKTLTAPVIATITNTGTLTLPTTTGTLSLGLSSKLLAATRDMSIATGSVSYTGVGFRPTCLQAFAANTALSTNNAVNGYCDSALNQAALRAGIATPGQYVYLASVLIYLAGSDTAYQTFAVTSFDADGFTGTWTRTGAPGGTQSIAFLAFK